jgi:hypothetical protein
VASLNFFAVDDGGVIAVEQAANTDLCERHPVPEVVSDHKPGVCQITLTAGALYVIR